MKKGAERVKTLNIPVGVSDFEKIRENGFYYVDKSGLLEELLTKKTAEVTLITRPRRFGKTLGMSMLESFFDIRKDSQKLFEGLEITKQQDLCEKWMNQYPTVFVSFRQVDGLNFDSAYDMFTLVISNFLEYFLNFPVFTGFPAQMGRILRRESHFKSRNPARKITAVSRKGRQAEYKPTLPKQR